MPVHCPIRFQPLSKDAFGKLDFAVMAHAFACHTGLGRLADEQIYKGDFASRLNRAGFHAQVEIPARVSFRTFTKSYSLDLVVNERAVYELKAVPRLTERHAGQLMNYLLLLGVDRGKLINFRPDSVETRFVNVAIDFKARRRFTVSDKGWNGGATLRDLVLDIVRDWGTGLEVSLYEQAVIQQLDVEAVGGTILPMIRDGNFLGNQKFHLADSDAAFRITAFSDDFSHYRRHLQQLLIHSPLSLMHHINITIDQITFTSITRS
ncbi:MAG: GxxExxY protein [Planctomycetaceae bacterium]